MNWLVGGWVGIGDSQGLCVRLQKGRVSTKALAADFLPNKAKRTVSLTTCHICLGQDGHRTSESCATTWIHSTWPSQLTHPSPQTVHKPRGRGVIDFIAEKNRSEFKFHVKKRKSLFFLSSGGAVTNLGPPWLELGRGAPRGAFGDFGGVLGEQMAALCPSPRSAQVYARCRGSARREQDWFQSPLIPLTGASGQCA